MVLKSTTKFLKELSKQKIKILELLLEQVSAMPGQGVTSMFNFGQSFGIIKGICSAMQLPIYFVRPAKWKKYLILLTRKRCEQNKSNRNIFRIFHHNYQKKKDSNKADAILIASFYHETHKKED